MVLAQNSHGPLARVIDRLSFGRPNAKFAQGLQTSLCGHPIRRLGAGTEDAIDRPICRHQWTEGETDVHLLKRKAASEEHQKVFRPRRLPGCINAVEHGTDRVPDLAPALASGPPKAPRVLRLAQKRDIWIVVQDREIPTPVHDDRNARGEAKPDGGLPVLWPVLWRAKVGLRPIEIAHQACELAIARKKALSVDTVLAAVDCGCLRIRLSWKDGRVAHNTPGRRARPYSARRRLLKRGRGSAPRWFFETTGFHWSPIMNAHYGMRRPAILSAGCSR